MLPLADISARVMAANPQLYSRLEYYHIASFFDTVLRLRPIITLTSPRANQGRLPDLPANVSEVLASQVGLPFSDINMLWECIGDMSLALARDDIPSRSLDESISLIAPLHDFGIAVLIHMIPVAHTTLYIRCRNLFHVTHDMPHRKLPQPRKATKSAQRLHGLAILSTPRRAPHPRNFSVLPRSA